MVYVVAWNEGTPVGASTPVADLDTEIQNLKVSIRERIEDVIPDWSNDGVDPKTIAISSIASPSRCKVYKTSSQVLTTGVAADVSWDAEVFDINDLHDNATNNSRITIPTGEGGDWIFSFCIHFSGANNGDFDINIRKNGSPLAATLEGVRDGGSNESWHLYVPLVVVATDFFEIRITQSTGADVTIGSGESISWFAAQRLI